MTQPAPPPSPRSVASTQCWVWVRADGFSSLDNYLHELGHNWGGLRWLGSRAGCRPWPACDDGKQDALGAFVAGAGRIDLQEPAAALCAAGCRRRACPAHLTGHRDALAAAAAAAAAAGLQHSWALNDMSALEEYRDLSCSMGYSKQGPRWAEGGKGGQRSAGG
jgi:hypothetical protein